MPESISRALLNWYDAHKRILPWRDISNPYATWVSETMLQQTRVETVLSYYKRFLTAFPTVEALAAAEEAEVLKLWEGLGYYSRARNLHAGARQVVDDFGGVIPQTTAELAKIKGIGPYTAGAIASIAYGQPVPAVDGNVIRVVSRLRGIRENVGIPSVKRQLEAEAAALIPAARPGDFNQALMDLGSGVCVPGTPDCAACPLRAMCSAFAEGDPEELPQLPRKNPPKPMDYDVCLIVQDGKALMRQRTETMLNGLWVYPMVDGHHTIKGLPAQVKKLTGLTVERIEDAGAARHVFTHQIWNMRLYTMQVEKGQQKPGWRFVSLDEMRALTIPTAMKAAKSLAEQLLGS